MAKIILYILSITITFFIYGISSPPFKISDMLSLSAIIATFGAALITLADIFERDKLERVKQNVLILYSDIFKSEKWTRWSFLKRKEKTKLLDNKQTSQVLENPNILFDIGSHNISIKLPTVQEDFFDLPIFLDFYLMHKYRKSFLTKHYRDRFDMKDESKSEGSVDMLMTFKCIYDILKCAVIFRISRLLKHFSIGLIIGSIIVLIFVMKFPHIIGFLYKK